LASPAAVEGQSESEWAVGIGRESASRRGRPADFQARTRGVCTPLVGGRPESNQAVGVLSEARGVVVQSS